MPRRKSNPFAINESRRALGAWPALLLLVLFVGVGVWFLPDAFDRWSTRQLKMGLDELPAIEQHARLDALSRLGEPGLRALVDTLLTAEEPTAQVAFQVLSETQQEVHFRAGEEAGVWHRRLMNAIEESRECRELVSFRRAWIEQLARQTLSETLHGKTLSNRLAYATAVRLLAMRNNDGRAVLASGTSPSLRPSIVDLGTATPISSNRDLQSLDSPSREQPSLDSPSRDEPTRRVGRLSMVVPTQVLPTLQRSHWQSPNPRSEPDDANGPSAADTFSGNGSLEPYGTRDVIDLLVGASDSLTLAARRELTRRGFSTADLAAATQLASPDAKKRLNLIANLGRHADIDPRPFLIWLCRDEDREVRLAAINALATMSDPLVRRNLQEFLNQEADPTVATQLRVALGIKSR